MHIHLCDTAVWFADEGGEQRQVVGQRAVLLRLLVLWPHQRVTAPLACHVLGIKKRSVPVYVNSLRGDLGVPDLVVSQNGQVAFLGDRESTDAAEFESLVDDALELARGDDYRSLDHDRAVQIERILEDAIAIWNGSPATGLDEVEEPEPNTTLHDEWVELESIVGRWIDLWARARMLRNDCRLVEGRSRQDAREACRDLMLIARTKDPPEEVWSRLLTAAALAGDRPHLRQAWHLCQKFYRDEYNEDAPADLAMIAHSTTEPNDLSRPTHPLEEPLVDDGADPRIALMELLGITTSSALQLRGSRLEPTDCIERTKSRLYFCGVLASKWVMDDGVRYEFSQLLQRLDSQDEQGDVRFLVIEPNGEAYQRLEQLRGGRLSDGSVTHLLNLAKRYASFEVRTVDRLPAFRIIVIDDEVVSFSPYALAEESYRTSRLGWAAPHVMLDPLAPWPLAAAFRLYFEETWSTAEPLTEGLA